MDIVTTLALGLRPRQGVARLQAKRETRGSHHMLLRMQRVWRNEPSPSQVSSHYGSWSPKWTLEFSKRDWKGWNPSVGKKNYIIGKLLKLRCLKWVRIAHLDMWNTSYVKHKLWSKERSGDSRPLKVGNQFNFLMFRKHATYRWKVLDKDYNFALDVITIRDLHAKLWAPKITGISDVRISGLSNGSPGTKNH